RPAPPHQRGHDDGPGGDREQRAGAAHERAAVAPELQAPVEELVAPPVELAEHTGQVAADAIDLLLQPRGLGARAHARRSRVHFTSSFSVRCVRSSGVRTRRLQPTRPAIVPAISTTPETISAAAHAVRAVLASA